MYDVTTMAEGGDVSSDLPEMIHEELLMCKICYGKYSTKMESLPKLLLCSHTFCAQCISEYLSKRKKKTKFPCPLCRKETSLTKHGIKGLTNNYTILGLIDLLHQTADTHHKRSSRTIHGTSPTQFAYQSAVRKSTRQNKYNTTTQVKAEAGFADLGIKWSPQQQVQRPPPHNPQYGASTPVQQPSVFSASSSTMSPGEKPAVPVRIPGAPSSIGRKRGKKIASTLLEMDRPDSLNFPTAPPDPYDDVTSVLSENTESGQPPVGGLRSLSPPQPPPRRVSSESLAATPIRCLKKFGRYSEARMQTNAFTDPTRVATSDVTGDIIVTDSVQMTLQVFSSTGEYISMFKVLGIQGACFYTRDKIAAATHMGVEIFKPNGETVKKLTVGSSACIVPYKFGFILGKTRTLQFFSNNLKQYKEINKIKLGKIKSSSFRCIQDIALNSVRDLIVLDSGRNEVLIMDMEGLLKTCIDPLKETCGRFKNPEGITTDKWNNILVSDTGNNRLLKFSANGTYARCLLNFKLWSSENALQTRGVTVTAARDRMVIIVTGQAQAYIAIYGL